MANDMMYVTLSNGVKMPQLGYGVYQVTQDECERCVRDALEVGYRHIDTAQSYFNEEQVGSAIAASGIDRGDIFLTTKVWIEHFGEGSTRASVEDSLRKLKTDYIDLLLLHQPFGDVFGAWRDMVKLYQEGKVRAIGISNFYVDRMVEFCEFNEAKPMVNQMERHPLNQNVELQKWETEYGIVPEAWAPFGEGRGGLFENPVLVEIGQAHCKTAAQVMLRWNLQRGVVVIPKSVHRERMEQNLDVFDFELSAEEMARIAAATGGDIFEITPENPYSDADLDWRDDNSRVTREHDDQSLRDIVLSQVTPDAFEEYETVFVGYPVWWQMAAWPVNRFVRDNDFVRKTVIPFCTSTSSSMGSTRQTLEQLAGSGEWLDGQRFGENPQDGMVEDWVESLDI